MSKGNTDKKRRCFLVLRKPLLFVCLCVRIVQFVGVCVFFLVVCGCVCVCVCVCVFFFNSRTYAQGHTPTVIQGGGEGGGGWGNGTPS